MTMNAKRTTGYVDVGPGRVWYESVGSGPALVLLHGGPGASSDYLTPLMALADDGYQVVRYDQLGSYMSDKPNDSSLWTAPRFAQELERVRADLGLGTMHLLGQSWGCFLALEYALTFPDQLRSLVLYSGSASTRECVEGMNRLRSELPAETLAVLTEHEARGDVTAPAYLDAMDVLYRRHLCRVDPYPEPLRISMERMAGPVYEHMWGPNEFVCTGTLLDWDRTDRLGEIRTPTLVTAGRYDEVVPSCAETIQRGIAGSQLVIFRESSHLAHLEEPEAYMAVLRGFLAEVETNSTGSDV